MSHAETPNPRRLAVRWSGSVATPEAQQFSRSIEAAQHKLGAVEALLAPSAYSPLDYDFIEAMVDPESLALAPAIAEYDVTYALEWDASESPTLAVDEVDLEIFAL